MRVGRWIDGRYGSATTGSQAGTTEASSTTDGDLEACVDAQDCRLLDTCCECSAYPASQRPEDLCAADCDQPMCEANGVSEVACLFGRCVPAQVPCDPNAVTCRAAPPPCDPGFVPGVEGNCWSQQCVRAELCDWVPDCDPCPEDMVWVTELPGPPPPEGFLYSRRCFPVPAACGDMANCECVGPPFCGDGGRLH